MKEINNLDLTDYNSYKLKSKCRKAFFPEKEEDIQMIYSNYRDDKIIVIGGGNNILLAKQYYDMVFVLLNNNFKKVQIFNCSIIAEPGILLYNLSQLAYERGLTGLEIFYDIPSTLGGAVVMNSGSGEIEMKNFVTKVRAFNTQNREFQEFKNEELNFNYRTSAFQDNANLIVTKVWLELKYGNKNEIKNNMELLKNNRWKKQPREFPNAGSVFKRPKGHFVGALIDKLNLKGYTIGGAKISEKHSGFIVNYNNASAEDILRLIKYIQDEVYMKLKVKLELEQKIIN